MRKILRKELFHYIFGILPLSYFNTFHNEPMLGLLRSLWERSDSMLPKYDYTVWSADILYTTERRQLISRIFYFCQAHKVQVWNALKIICDFKSSTFGFFTSWRNIIVYLNINIKIFQPNLLLRKNNGLNIHVKII